MMFKILELGILVLFISILLSIIFWAIKKFNSKPFFVGDSQLIKFFKQNDKNLLKKIRTALNITFLSLTILFLSLLTARPISRINKPDLQNGLDIMFVVDASGSMSTDDVKPTRLDASRVVMLDFIEKLQTDRVGLITFSSNTFTLAPLTFDYGVLKYYLELFTSDSSYWFVEGGGTAIGDGLLLATEKFQDDLDRTKVIVLITDGAYNEGIDPFKVAEYAAENDIKIYSIYVSADDYSYENAFKTLEDISEETDAKAYKATKKSDLEDIFNDIDKLERANLEQAQLSIDRDNPAVLTLLSLGSFIWYLISKRFDF